MSTDPLGLVPMDGKYVVIYVRYSDVRNQSADSCEQQARKARQALDAAGIDHTNAIVLEDMGLRGDVADRQAFMRLIAMIDKGHVAVLAVDEQSRFGRSFNVPGLIQDLVFNGGRFITFADNIDTDRPGWEESVGLRGMMNNAESRTTGRRVRRGMEEMVLNDKSAGDWPMGYRSVRPPEPERRAAGPRRKDRADIVIDDAAAAVVRQIFDLFVGGMSVTAIARYLRAHDVPKYSKGRRAPWSQQYVRKVLQNEKYIGRWRYKRLTTVKNSQGKKKHRPVDPAEQIVRDRPTLRIISQDVWDRALALRNRNAEIWGKKPGHKKGGPRPSYTLAYPKSLLSGIVRCGSCAATLHLYRSDEARRLRCPNVSTGECTARTGCPVDRAEAAVTEAIAGVLQGCPAWVAAASQLMREAAERLVASAPKEIDPLRRRLVEVRRSIANLVAAVAAGMNSPSVAQKLVDEEVAASRLAAELSKAERLAASARAVPTDEEVAAAMRALAERMRDDAGSRVALRGLLRDVRAEEVIPPGRVRGHVRLHFTLGIAGLLRLATGDRPEALEIVDAVVAVTESGSGTADDAVGVTFALDIGQTSQADRLGAEIAALHEAKLSWQEIADRLGLATPGGAYMAFRRWRERTAKSSPGEQSDVGGCDGGQAAPTVDDAIATGRDDDAYGPSAAAA